jgi:hypothetical protein
MVPACRALSLHVLLATWVLLVCSLHPAVQKTFIKNFLVEVRGSSASAFSAVRPKVFTFPRDEDSLELSLQKNACSFEFTISKGLPSQ